MKISRRGNPTLVWFDNWKEIMEIDERGAVHICTVIRPGGSNYHAGGF